MDESCIHLSNELQISSSEQKFRPFDIVIWGKLQLKLMARSYYEVSSSSKMLSKKSCKNVVFNLCIVIIIALWTFCGCAHELPTACIACISLLLPFRMQFLMRQTLKKSGVYEKKGME